MHICVCVLCVCGKAYIKVVTNTMHLILHREQSNTDEVTQGYWKMHMVTAVFFFFFQEHVIELCKLIPYPIMEMTSK